VVASRLASRSDRIDRDHRSLHSECVAQQVFSPARVVRWATSAVRDPRVDRRELWRTTRRDVRREAGRIVEQRLFARRRAASARLPQVPASSSSPELTDGSTLPAKMIH
jgi:hypothetical protein